MDSVIAFTSKTQPMPDTSTRYRIAHVDRPTWYWSVASIWGLKQDAEIFTESERAVKSLPPSGCWETVETPAEQPSAVRRPLDRSIVALTISRYLWTQHCHEEGLKVVPRLQDVPAAEAKRFIDAGEFITNFTLSPERTETAILAMADVICADGDEVLSIFNASPRTQKHLYALAVSAIHALQENVKEVPPDWHYRDRLCRLVDTIVPKGGA